MAYPQHNYSMYGGYNYTPAQQLPQQSGIICRPVASREEAAMAQVPFDGNPYIFINLSAGQIFTKQFNYNTGNTDFVEYARIQPEEVKAVQFATIDELNALRAEIEQLRKPKAKKVDTDE